MDILRFFPSVLAKTWAVIAGIGVLALFLGGHGTAQKPAGDANDDYAKVVRPLMKKYCLDCHSTKVKKGSLDLERFGSLQQIRKDLKPWQQIIEQLEAGEMPPKGKPQPTAVERKQLIGWVHGFLETEAKARTGDPGRVPLRRLSNAEYDCTIRDLTSVDLRPTREFPADGAAGEGFTNAAESLSDITPALLTKYLNAAKDIADHAVLLPDGFRFSPGKTRRDWSDESVARLRKFYGEFTGGDGRLSFQPYLLATVRYRDAVTAGKLTLAEVAGRERINPKYLGILWQTLTDKAPSYPLDLIRARWRTAAEKDVGPLTAEIAAWQKALWKYTAIGSYRVPERQIASDPAVSESQTMKLAVKPAPGQNDVVIYLTSRDASPHAKGGQVLWHRPRFEGAGKPPLLLRDYEKFGPAFEVDYATVFAGSSKYLAAAALAAHDRKLSLAELAQKNELDPVFLKRWIEVLAVVPLKKDAFSPGKLDKTRPAVALQLLDEKNPTNAGKPAINGWRKKGTDLPVLVTNSSNTLEKIPGTLPAHGVAVHPTPSEFVAVAWKSPLAGNVRIQGRVLHAHPACGNGVAWWLEHRRAGRAAMLADGAIDVGAEVKLPTKTMKVEIGDLLVLAVDARNGNHVCDLTELEFTVTEEDKPGRIWNLAADIAGSVLAGNPHADKHGHKDTWSFVRGPSRPTKGTASSASPIPSGSILGRWKEAAADPTRPADAGKLAQEVEGLLVGRRPRENDANRILYDNLVSPDSVVLKGLELSRFARPRPKGTTYALDKARFGRHPDGKPVEAASLVVPANTVTEIRLPAALFRGREFVVEGKLDGTPGERIVQFQVLTVPPGPDNRWDGKSAIVASPKGAGVQHLIQGYADFRRVFPTFLCFPNVVPTDEVVSLKMFHREDEPLDRLFLDEKQKVRIDHLWSEHLFISQQALAENNYLPQFIGFVTQDQPKSLVEFFEKKRPEFKKRADDYAKIYQAAIPKHLDAIPEFASRAFRRPLQGKEKGDLLELYKTLRKKEASHEEACRGVIARILVSPAFLFRIEKAPPGVEPGLVDDWELATRLSYFLWSSAPDDELRRLAAEGKLRDPKVLEAQARRMLKDDRLRSLAIEFGTQWIHVRNFDELKEKNEKIFPTFNANLRKAIYEESILFFHDLFREDRPVTHILDADATYLNETMAKHYCIPGVTGPKWRRVEGMRKYGRGGILGLASVQAKQSGASRTSPVLRGNWVVETLLGEKLPRPPANVPILPDEQSGKDRLTTRQMVEKHASVASCAVCHVRIDPFGFALEKYDAIGRLRGKDAGGHLVDAKAKLRDGTEFEGIDGLRSYLLTKKKDVIVRLFSRRLLGYALGRATTLSDTSLIDDMVAAMNRDDGRVSAAVLTIVRSPQFRKIRGSEHAE